MTRRTVTPADVAQWVEDFHQGSGPYQIAQRHGWGHPTVMLHLERAGIVTRSTRRVVTTTDVRAWEAAYDRGESINAIAVAHDRIGNTVRDHLAPSGRLPNKKRPRSARSLRVLELIAQGVENHAIAERLGVKKTTISRLRYETKRRAS